MAATTLLSDNGVTSGITGYTLTGGNDGTLQLQTTTAGGTATTAVTIDASQNTTFAQAANLPNTFGFKNRIINGGMMIDQRNAGAAVTVSTNVFTLDRWLADEGGMNAYTVQQSTTVPTGFKNSLKCTMGTAVTIDATDYAFFRQTIEGYNIYDFNLGSASSSAFTLSFWVQASVAGTFGVSFRNNAANATWCSTYTISAVNTWEYKTVTVAAGAINSGTWLTDNGAGMSVFWDLGVGATYSGTANQLNTGANYFGVTGTTKLASTTGATFYITGVQLEKGTVATSFDYRPYTTELQLCQRYCYLLASGSSQAFGMASYQSSTYIEGTVSFPVTMRSTPTLSATTGVDYYGIYVANNFDYFNTLGTEYGHSNGATLYCQSNLSGTTGQAGWLSTKNASSKIIFEADL